MRRWLGSGVSPYAAIPPLRDSTCAYTVAAERGYDDVVAVIDAAAPADRCAPPEEFTPEQVLVYELYESVRRGQHGRAEQLLQSGADPNGEVYASGTPLSEAYGQRDDRMVALLLSHGGRPNPSMAGFCRRKDLALQLLALHGDTPLPDDGFGAGPVAEQLIAAAARGGDPEILQFGLDRVDWPAADPRWYPALHATLEFWNHGNGPWCHLEWDRSGYLECFRRLLARLGPPVHAPRFGITLLHAIVAMGGHIRSTERVEFAQAALQAGARLNARDELFLSTPLGWACRYGRRELVVCFLRQGADPVEASAEPWAAPGVWAHKKGNREITAVLAAAACGPV